MVGKAGVLLQLNGALCNLHKTTLSFHCFCCFSELLAWDVSLKYSCSAQNCLPLLSFLYYSILLVFQQSGKTSSYSCLKFISHMSLSLEQKRPCYFRSLGRIAQIPDVWWRPCLVPKAFGNKQTRWTISLFYAVWIVLFSSYYWHQL